jgi:2-phospho-L-lactate transferase/gluconeogenesis factor (CofD/UPF0052 family)
VLAPDELVIAVNTGDDFEHLGLHISPDLDTVMYTLAGINDTVQGWGIAGETWSFMQALEKWAAKPGSVSAIAISRRTSSARAAARQRNVYRSSRSICACARVCSIRSCR